MISYLEPILDKTFDTKITGQCYFLLQNDKNK